MRRWIDSETAQNNIESLQRAPEHSVLRRWLDSEKAQNSIESLRRAREHSVLRDGSILKKLSIRWGVLLRLGAGLVARTHPADVGFGWRGVLGGPRGGPLLLAVVLRGAFMTTSASTCGGPLLLAVVLRGAFVTTNVSTCGGLAAALSSLSPTPAPPPLDVEVKLDGGSPPNPGSALKSQVCLF